MNWKPITDHPPHEPYYEAPRVLVYGAKCGVQMGKVYRYPDGHVAAVAEGFNGSDWGITHYQRIPSPPAVP